MIVNTVLWLCAQLQYRCCRRQLVLHVAYRNCVHIGGGNRVAVYTLVPAGTKKNSTARRLHRARAVTRYHAPSSCSKIRPLPYRYSDLKVEDLLLYQSVVKSFKLYLWETPPIGLGRSPIATACSLAIWRALSPLLIFPTGAQLYLRALHRSHINYYTLKY